MDAVTFPAFRSNYGLRAPSLAAYVESKATAPVTDTASGAAYVCTLQSTGTRPTPTGGDLVPPHERRRVTLSALDVATDDAAAAALQGATNVEHVAVLNTHLTDARLAVIASHCPFIAVLELKRVSGVTAAGLSLVVLSSPQLQEVSLVECPDVFVCSGQPTDTSFTLPAALGRGPLSMHCLTLARCPGVCDETVLALSGTPEPTVVSDAVPPAAVVTTLDDGDGDGVAASAAGGGGTAPVVDSDATSSFVGAQPPGLSGGVAPSGSVAASSALGSARDGDASTVDTTPVVPDAGAGGRRGSLTLSLPPFGLPPLYDAPSLPLRDLDLSGCGAITDRSLGFIASTCVHLRSLNLALCDHATLSAAGVGAIAQHCPKLEHLDLTGCSQLDGLAVRTVARYCSSLTSLSLAGCFRPEAEALNALVACPSARKLKVVDLTRCEQLLPDCFKSLLRRWKALEEINVTLCPLLADEDLIDVSRLHPDVAILRPRRQYSDASAPALVPGFRPPPRSEAFASRAFWSTVKAAGKGKKKGKAKGGKGSKSKRK